MPGSSEKFYFLDACRAGFMLLGVVLHATVPFMPDMDWLVKSTHQHIVLGYVYHFIHAFRMPGFFLLAGFFAALVLSRRPPVTWFVSRLERLGIPLVFGMLFIVPTESIAIGFLTYLTGPDSTSGDVLRAALKRHSIFGIDWVSHLWFLVDLLILSGALALAYVLDRRRLLAQAGKRALALFKANGAVAPIAAICCLSLYLLAVEVLAYSRFGGYLTYFGRDRMWGVLDVSRVLYYLPFFALGVLLWRDAEFRSWFIRPSRAAWAAAAASTVVFIYLHAHAHHWARLAALAAAPASILLVRVSLQIASALLSEKNALVQQGVDCSYTVYVVHHPILIFATVLAVWLDMGVVTGFTFVLSIALVLSLAIYWGTRSVPLAVLALNGVRPKITRASSRAALIG